MAKNEVIEVTRASGVEGVEIHITDPVTHVKEVFQQDSREAFATQYQRKNRYRRKEAQVIAKALVHNLPGSTLTMLMEEVAGIISLPPAVPLVVSLVRFIC